MNDEKLDYVPPTIQIVQRLLGDNEVLTASGDDVPEEDF